MSSLAWLYAKICQDPQNYSCPAQFLLLYLSVQFLLFSITTERNPNFQIITDKCGWLAALECNTMFCCSTVPSILHQFYILSPSPKNLDLGVLTLNLIFQNWKQPENYAAFNSIPFHSIPSFCNHPLVK